MTTPTLEQLAQNIAPDVRDYIALAVTDAVTKALAEVRQAHASMELLVPALAARSAEMKQFEREVRTHLGIYIPE